MAICNLDQNKELAKALGNYLIVSIKDNLKSDKPFRFLDAMNDVYQIAYEKDQDINKALGVAGALPGLFEKVLKKKPEYIFELSKKGFKLDPIIEFKSQIEKSATPLQTVGQYIRGIGAPTVSQILKTSTDLTENAGITLNKEAENIQLYKDAKLIKQTFFATTIRTQVKKPDGTFEIDQKDPVKVATQNTVAQLLMQQGSNFDFENVKYQNHTGFRLRALIESTLPNPEKNAYIPDGNNVILAVTDKKGNFLYFDDNGNITTADKGKIVYQYLQSIEPEKVKIKKASLLALVKPSLEKKAGKDKALLDQLIKQEEKIIDRVINDEVRKIGEIKGKVAANEEVLLNITGGEVGFIDDKNTSVTLGDMIEKGGLTDEEIASIGKVTGYYNGIQTPAVNFKGFNQFITLKGLKLKDSSPELVDAVVDLLVEDLVDAEGKIVSPQEKIDLTKQFLEIKLDESKARTNKLRLAPGANDKVNIFLGTANTPLALDNKEEAKQKLKDFINAYAHHTYMRRTSDAYTTFTVNDGVLKTKTELGYQKYIAKYLVPRIMVDQKTGTPMINNGYFSFSPINLTETVAKEAKETSKNAQEVINKPENKPLPEQDNPLPDLFERSKLIASRSNKIQEKAADKWMDETAILKVMVDGKPVITAADLRNIVNSDAFATFSKATMTVYKGGNSTHMYHEAWHAFSQVFLSKDKRDELYTNASKLNTSFTYIKKIAGPGGNTNKSVTVKLNKLNPKNPADRKILEEFIAEEFRVFAMNGGEFKVKDAKASLFGKIFKAIWEFLKAIFKGALPVNVYSNPGSDVFAEMFNVLYNAKEPSDLNMFQPSIKKGEQFGTLNTGIVGKLSQLDLDLLAKSMDGIISETITNYILGVGTKDSKKIPGAAMAIFNPKNLNNLYNVIVKGRFERRLAELVAEQKANEGKWSKTQNDYAINNITVLEAAIDNFGDINSVLKSKNPENSVVAYHLRNSAFSGRIKEAQLDPTERANTWEDLMANNDKNPNDFESEELATANARYIIESLVQQEYNADKSAITNKLNELGFPQTIEFKPFWNFLMGKVAGQQNTEDLYDALVKLKNKKVSPLVSQLLDKLGNPAEVMNESKVAADLWLGVVRSMNPPRKDFHNNIFDINIIKEGEEDTKEILTSVSGKVSGDYFNIRNNIWKNKFNTNAGPYVKVNPNTQQNELNLDIIAQEFLTDPTNPKQRALTGLILEYRLKPNTDPVAFLNAIGLYVSNDDELRNALDPEAINSIANAIGYAAFNNKTISDPVKFLNDSQILTVRKLQGSEIVELKNFRTKSNASNVNGIAQLEAEYSTEYSQQMKPLPSGDKKSIYSFNSTVSRTTDAINKVNNISELGNANNKYGIVPQLIYMKNPKVMGSVYVNSLFENGVRKKSNFIEARELVGAQVRISDGKSETVEGISQGEMTGNEKFVSDVQSMLSTGFIEALRNGEKSTYTGIRLEKIETDPLYNKKSNHLFFDTEDYQVDVNGLPITGVRVNSMLVSIMHKKLEGELRVIQKLKQGITPAEAEELGIDPKDAKDFYRNNVKNFANGFKFDWFEEVLESIEDGSTLKKQLIDNYADQLSPTSSNNLVDLLLSTDEGKELKKKIDAQIMTYFGNLANRFKDHYVKIYGQPDGTVIIPDFLKNLTTKKLTDVQKGKVTDQGSINALMMSFAVNTALHTDEILLMFFGDGFQFNHNKDEAIKRVPTYHSPGIVFSTDNNAVGAINKFYPRDYEKKLIEDGVITGRTSPRYFNKVGQKAIIKDPTVATLQYESYEKLFKNILSKREYTEDEINKLLYGKGDQKEPGKDSIMHTWKNITMADGQGYVAFDYYRMLKANENNWTNAQEIVYQKEIKGEYISAEEIFDAFPVYKLQYAGALALPGDMYPIQSIDKFSLLPLIPSLVKNSPLETIHKEMIQQGVDYILFDSGAKRSYIKAGESNGDEIFEGNDTSKLVPGFKFTKNPFFVDYLKNQTEVNRSAKKKATLSTQFRKIFDTGLYYQGLPIDYTGTNEQWKKLTHDQKEKESKIYKNTESVLNELDRLTTYMRKNLLKEMGWKEVNGKLQTLKGDQDLTTMLSYIKGKLKEQGYSQHEIDSIETDNNKIDLSTSAIAPRLERFLFSIINNRLVKLKIFGEPFVQVSSAFFGFTKATEEQKAEFKDDDFGLSGYVVDPDGKENTKGVKIKIALTKNYENLYQTFYFKKNKAGAYENTGETIAVYNDDLTINHEESFKRLNEMIKVNEWLSHDNNREKIQITGVRIPVQGPNSTEFAEVHEFLPPSAGTIIIIPREIVAKSGGDFDVDKLTMYIKHITKQGSLLLDTFDDPQAIDSQIKELEAKMGTLTKKALGINDHLADFRKAIEEVKDYVEFSKEQIEAFTSEDGKALLETLSNEGNQKYLAEVAPEAFEIYNKRIKSFDVKEYDNVQKAIIELRNKNTDLAKTYNKLADLKEHKRNFTTAIQNSMLNDLIKVLEMPEMAFSLLLPNGTYLAKPQADDLKKIISKVDNEVDYNKSINTGEKIPGRETGVNPGVLRDYSYNLDKQQAFAAGKGILGPIVLEIPVNSQLNKAGTLLQADKEETISIKEKGETKQYKVKTPLTLELKHNSVNIGTTAKEIRRISMSNILDADKKNQIADVLSQLANGAVDVGKDAWIAYLQGNLEAIPKLLFLLETGVPATDAFYFMNNPLIREYVATKQKAGSRLAKLFFGAKHSKKDMVDEFRDKKLKEIEGVNPAAHKQFNTFWGKYNLMKSFITSTGVESAFELDKLKDIAKGKGTKDQIMACFLEYLYVETLTEQHDKLKQAIDVDNNTSGDNAEIQAKIEQIKNTKNIWIYDQDTLDYIINHSVISSFFIQEMASDLFGERLFEFRANKTINKFIRDIFVNDFGKITSLKSIGLGRENFPSRFKNALTQHLFTNALAEFDLKTVLKDGYNSHSVSKLLDGSKVGNLDQIRDDFNTQKYLGNNSSDNSYVKRGLFPINPASLRNLTENDFIKLNLEREYLRKVIMPLTPLLKESKEFQSLMKRFDKQIEADLQINDWANLPMEDKENTAYEYMILHQALLNTFNNNEMFSSGENTVATKLLNIIRDYPELSIKYKNLMTRFGPDILISPDKLNLRRNFKLKANTDISDAEIADYFKNWNELADPSKHKLDGSKPEDLVANKYISDFFSKLPLYAFLQSGLDPSEFSMNSVMPQDRFKPIMDAAVQKFKNDVLSKSEKDVDEVLSRFFNLFLNKNSKGQQVLRKRGIDYKKELYKLEELTAEPEVQPIKESLLTYDQREAFKAAVEKNQSVLPKEYFTTPESKWLLNPNNLYDLVDKNTGEIYLRDVNLETGYQEILSKPIMVEEGSVRGELAMQPGNIEQIKQGTKTLTARTYKIENGVYTLPDGTKVSVKYIGKAAVITEKGMEQIAFVEGNPLAYAPYRELDDFAKAEGFIDWADFKKNAKFSENFINGKQSRYIYLVRPVTKSTKTVSKEVIQPGLEVYKNALTKQEQKEFYNFGKSVLEKHGYNPFPQYVMASAGEMEWSPEVVVGKDGKDYVRSGNYNTKIISHKKKVKGSDGKGRWAYHYYLSNLDGSKITPIPTNIIKSLEKVTGQDMSDYDTVLINLYPIGRTLGWHVDVSEDHRNMDRDIISVSIGADADFHYANTPDSFISGTPSKEETPLNLKSGDVVSFGGKSRLIAHTVKNVTGTTDLGSINLSNSNVNQFFKGGLDLDNWRMNFTFRVADPTNNKGKKSLEEPDTIIVSEVETTKKPTPEFDKLPGKSDTPTMTYAGIGSRETPQDVLDVMTKAATYLESLGYTLRSGGAEGADTAFEKGVKSKKQIFKGFDKTGDTEKKIAHEIHPNLQGAMEGSKKRAVAKGKDGERSAKAVENLMARNTNQIFGNKLDTPVDFVLAYDPSGWTGKGPRPVKGGTLQAIDMAARKGIPVINMADPNWREQLKEVLKNKPAVQPAVQSITTQSGKVLEGDIFALPGIPIITTNLGGVHGAGLAQAAKAKGLIKQGDGDFKATDSVVQLPVKRKWSDSMNMNNNMELLKQSLSSLVKVSKENPTKTYLLPLAGLGHGEGSVEEILPLLIATVKASPNIKLVLPAEGVSLGRQGTVRKDYTRENMPKIKQMLSEAGLLPTQEQPVKALPNDKYKYYGAMYEIVRDAQGKGIDVVGYKGKAGNKEALLVAYNTNPNIDPQNGKPFRGEEAAKEEKAFEEKVPEKKQEKKYELFPGVYANEGQKIAIDRISDFLKSKDDEFLLKGRGGTGKTTIIKKAIANLPEGSVIGATVAYEAKEVLQENMPGYTTTTIASLLGLVPDYDAKTGQVFFRERDAEEEAKFRALGKSDPIETKRYIIIDEASMLSQYLYDKIIEKKLPNAKVIFMGDNVQIPPIDEKGGSKDSPVWELADTKNFAELNERMRQGAESPILPITDVYAENVENMQNDRASVKDPLTNRTTNFDGKEGVIFTTNREDMINSFVEDVRNSNNLKEAIIVGARNVVVDEINDIVRKKLFNTTEAYVTGDRVRVNSPYVVDGIVEIPNGFKGKVTRIREQGANIPGMDLMVYELTVSYTKVNSKGETVEASRTFSTISPKDKAKLKAAINQLAVIAKSYPKKSAQANAAWKNFFKLKNSIVDIGYNYAITAHKVQGSTYNSAYVLEGDIMSFPGGNEQVNRMMYTAVSRPRKKLVIYAPTQTVVKPETKTEPVPEVKTTTPAPTPVAESKLDKRKKVILRSWKESVKQLRIDEILAEKGYDINDFIANLEAAQTDAEVNAIINKLNLLIC